MKALVIHQTGLLEQQTLRLAEAADPSPQAGQVLIKVRACGVCRTDLHVIEGDLPATALPIIPGHQVVGTVIATGPDASRFSPGDRVGVAWLQGTCGDCEYCASARENLCGKSVYTGYTKNGGYAELIAANEDFVYRLPDALDDLRAAPLLCAGIIGYRALKLSALPRGGKLAVYGFGSSAHITAQIALSRGAEIYVATRQENHRKFALKLGAVWAGGASEPLPERVDSAIIFAPAGELVPAALRALKKGGTLALAGVHMSPVPELDYEQCLFHEKILRSVESNTRADGEELLKLAAEIPLQPVVTEFPFAETGKALRMLKAGEIDGTAVVSL